jgi:hypothetical protein
MSHLAQRNLLGSSSAEKNLSEAKIAGAFGLKTQLLPKSARCQPFVNVSMPFSLGAGGEID